MENSPNHCLDSLIKGWRDNSEPDPWLKQKNKNVALESFTQIS
jgi:hypothetical protein